MIVFPNAKINIGLYITGEREDGYHNIETIFYPIPQKQDVLEVIPSHDNNDTLHLNGIAIDGELKNNIVWNALELLRKDFGTSIPPIDIYLLKAIPTGAGLGGGSADGACMLMLLNDMFQLSIDEKKLLEYALKLGSDCPFFIYNTPCFAKGRGEILQKVNLDLSNYEIKIITPDIQVSTASAYASIASAKANYDMIKIDELPLDEWKNLIINDFEEPVFTTYPELEEIKNSMYKEGAIYASLSGSGSSVYGIFPKS